MRAHAACPVFDGHNDTLSKLYRSPPEGARSFFERAPDGHLDLPRARAGGFGGGFFSVFVPPLPETLPAPPDQLIVPTATGYEVPPLPALDPAHAQRQTLAMIGLLYRLEAASAGALEVARTARDVARCLQRGVLAAVLHLEGAEAIDPGLESLEAFHGAGLRALGLVWSRPNAFAHGVPFRFPSDNDTGPGLSEAGRALVCACNRLRILIDLAHLNRKGFWEVAALSDAPLVVSHAAAHTLCPSTRNLTNDQLDAIAQTGGLVGISFNVRDLRADGRTELDTPLIEIVRHVNFISRRVGIEHVALGSDFDGTKVPNELGDAAGLPKLLAALEEAGYDRHALRLLAHKNWLRVLRRTWGG